MTRTRLLNLAPFFGLALLVLLFPAPLAATPTIHQVTMTADQFTFDPSVLRVNRGDRVLLTLHAADVVHGFYLDGYGLQTRLEPGISQQVEFIADRAGKYRFRCSVSCGTLHPFMSGELVVRPNLTFIRALGLTLVVLVGTLYYLRRFPPRDTGEYETSQQI